MTASPNRTAVVICLQIRIFDISNTPAKGGDNIVKLLWFAYKFVSLTYQTHRFTSFTGLPVVVICLQIRIFDISNTPGSSPAASGTSCDLLTNSYLWHIKHTYERVLREYLIVVICLQIRIFDISNTPKSMQMTPRRLLWFAYKFVSLTYQTHLGAHRNREVIVVICLQIRIFDISNTPRAGGNQYERCCDLLTNSYLWHIKHTQGQSYVSCRSVVICLQIRIFDISNTPVVTFDIFIRRLWFAYKFVSLTYQTHHNLYIRQIIRRLIA